MASFHQLLRPSLIITLAYIADLTIMATDPVIPVVD